MKKYITLILIFFSILYGTVKAIEITIIGNDDTYPMDWFSFNTVKNSNIIVGLVDKLSQGYINGERMELFQVYDNGNNGRDSYINVGTGILQSQLYGDFYMKYGSIKLLNDTTVNLNCDNISYSFSGKLYSPSFGELDINKNNSYYCPLSLKSQLTLQSDSLGVIVINGNEIIETLDIVNARGEKINIKKTDIFDDKKISVNGVNNIQNKTGLSSGYSGEDGGTVDYTKNTKLEFSKNLGKNLIKYTKWIESITNSYSLSSLDYTKRVFYYNYEGQEEYNFSNKENKGKILTLGDGATENDTVMGVYGQQLLYIKGGNLYINTDISNNDKKSQLVIVVKRDSKNRKNGGNVYINPDVTNIDATIIADGSIISYDGNTNTILNAEDYTDLLRKQLLIFGSLSTKNTYGEDNATYGTDDYISNGGNLVSNIKTYNLAKLRSFQVILNDDVVGDCVNPKGEIVAKGNTGTGAIKYAFAGKKKCFITGNSYAGLRSTEKVTSLVIEYNPIIQSNPHFILKK